MATWDDAEKYNNKMLHNNKARDKLTDNQKQQRKKAKKLKKVMKAISMEGKEVDTIKEIIGSTERPISQTKMEVGEEVVLQRIERSQQSDSDSDWFTLATYVNTYIIILHDIYCC